MTDLVIGDDLAFVLQNENLLENKLNIMGLIEILGAIGRYDLAKELSIFLARGQYYLRLPRIAIAPINFVLYCNSFYMASLC